MHVFETASFNGKHVLNCILHYWILSEVSTQINFRILIVRVFYMAILAMDDVWKITDSKQKVEQTGQIRLQTVIHSRDWDNELRSIFIYVNVNSEPIMSS